MAYIAPSTRITGEIITAAIWNQDIVANITAMKAPPTELITLDNSVDYTTSSIVFADIHSTDLSVDITTEGGDLMIGFSGTFMTSGAGTGHIYLDFTLDGVREGGDDGIIGVTGPGSTYNLHLSFGPYLVQGLDPDTYRIRPQWKVSAGVATGTLFAGAGTSTRDFIPQFWVREVS